VILTGTGRGFCSGGDIGLEDAAMATLVTNYTAVFHEKRKPRFKEG
jgi:enoyl-CoA hydratase/carnithine racemase